MSKGQLNEVLELQLLRLASGTRRITETMDGLFRPRRLLRVKGIEDRNLGPKLLWTVHLLVFSAHSSDHMSR